jgi:hypothetical protein
MRIKLNDCHLFRFLTVEDINWFEKTVKRVTEEDIGEKFVDHITTNRYFVDFLR